MKLNGYSFLLLCFGFVFFSGCKQIPNSNDSSVKNDRPGGTIPVEVGPPPGLETRPRYYVLFLAYQEGRNLVWQRRYSHTFAHFMKVGGPNASGDQLIGEEFSISWMPASGVVRPLGGAEPGENTDYLWELNRGKGPGRAGFVWGPYEITPETYERAQVQHQFLETSERNQFLENSERDQLENTERNDLQMPRTLGTLYKAAGRDSGRSLDYIAAIQAVARGLAPVVHKTAVFPQFLNCLAAVSDIAPGGGASLWDPRPAAPVLK